MKILDNEYEIIENYKEGFDITKIKELYTDYFDNYDYILGDWSYGKLRLKGFCDKTNKMCNRINDIKFKDNLTKKIYFSINIFLDIKLYIITIIVATTLHNI